MFEKKAADETMLVFKEDGKTNLADIFYKSQSGTENAGDYLTRYSFKRVW